MSKQNGTKPKYILIASPACKSTQKLISCKKSSLYSKKQQTADQNNLTLPHRNIDKFDEVIGITKKEAFKSFNKEVRKDIESTRGDLNECMNDMVGQERKNDVLRGLVAVLQAEMKQMEYNEKQVRLVQNEENLKKAHKIQYDLEQILQKHNQEVAKINTLQEQVASARSDRVVFSNLFKKIEKEIKHNEDYYRTATLQTEITRQKRAQKELKQLQLSKQQSADQFEGKDQNTRLSANKIVKLGNPDSRIFVTSPPLLPANTNKKVSDKAGESAEGSSEKLKFMIQEVETKIEKLTKTTECASPSEAIAYYNSIVEENRKLTDLISEEDSKIEDAQFRIERIRLERRNSEVLETRQLVKLESLSSTRKIRSIKKIKTTLTQQSENYDDDIDVVLAIFEMLGIVHEKSIQYLLSNEDILSALQSQIEGLSSVKPMKKSQSNISCSNGVDHDLENLLTKMQKFDSCDRILNKKQFYSQYIKEITKNKRSNKSKK